MIKNYKMPTNNKFQIVNIGHIFSRSGTLYLHSLLDNHPEIITIPGVVNFNFLFRELELEYLTLLKS